MLKNQMQVTAFHMLDNLASRLYESEAQCLMELIRNGLVASMEPQTWQPHKARIHLMIVPNHPLSPKGKALVVLDQGCGLTDPALDRYFKWLGTPLEALKADNGHNNGASQKGIGRLAALALNAKCHEGHMRDRIAHGYYLFSRTSATGDVRYIPVIPEKIESEGYDTNRVIPSTAHELHELRSLKGSFTAIVIPNPVFDTHEEIWEAIKWHVPREADKMFHLEIGGKVMSPPPLEEAVVTASRDGEYRARIGVSKQGSGVWLCDSETGLRVASCVQLGRLLPEPLWFPELVGDIFVPKLLAHQNTARSSLAKELTKKSNREWQKLLMFLIREVSPQARALLDRDVIKSDVSKMLGELVDMFNDRFGPPKEPKRPPPKDRDPKEPKEPRPRPEPDPDREPRERNRRFTAINVKGETYLLYYGRTLEPTIFAEVDLTNNQLIHLNMRGGYKALPRTKAAMREHCLMQILAAIGRSKFPNDREAVSFANGVRAEFLEE